MPYRVTFKETILEEYRDILTFEFPTVDDNLFVIHHKHTVNGNILDAGVVQDIDPYNRIYSVLFKDKAAFDLMVAECDAVIPGLDQTRGRIEGFAVSDYTEEEV